MTIGQTLSEFQAEAAQCDKLIANAHKLDSNGDSIFSPRDREQITVAAFLNLFIAWEEFIELSITDFMMGGTTVGGSNPIRYATPPTREHSNKMVVHTQRFFDYANHENVRKIAKLFFDSGYPFETPLSSINAELVEIKTIRNACAHMSSTTNATLTAIATRILGQPQKGITVYQLLTTIDPRIQGNSTTVYAGYRDKLIAAATLVARG